MPQLDTRLAGSQFIRTSDTLREFGGPDALPLLKVNAPFCQATILLQGAQLLTFQPAGSEPWLWLSPHAQFENGKSPRGGIPVCLPWFGVNRQDPQKPKHGFARNRDWQLVRWQESTDSVQLALSLTYTGDTPALFDTPFTATLLITLSTQLDMELTLHNTGKTAAEFSWALHTYFAVDHCEQTQVSGLQSLTCLDNTQELQAITTTGPVQFLQEVDSIYNHTTEPQTVLSRQPLTISGHHCPTCIVWNAGKTAAAGIADIRDSYWQYVCVERGCAFDDSLTLQAGDLFRADMQIRPA